MSNTEKTLSSLDRVQQISEAIATLRSFYHDSKLPDPVQDALNNLCEDSSALAILESVSIQALKDLVFENYLAGRQQRGSNLSVIADRNVFD